MTKEEIQYIYDHSPKKSHLVRSLEIRENQNGYNIDAEILVYLSKIGITNKEQISGEYIRKHYKEIQEQEYLQNSKICKKCGKVVPFSRSKYSETCSPKCARSIGNSRVMSEETKEKIRNTYKQGIKEHKYNLANQYGVYFYGDINKKDYRDDDIYKDYKLISDLINEKIIINPDNYLYKDKFIKVNSLIQHKCIICGKEFYARVIKSGRIGGGNTCCEKCHSELASLRSKESRAKEIAAGTFKGWMSRNTTSYAEKFWKKVLDNNNIQYIKEYKLENPNSSQYYFLDFYIKIGNRKIDLEIDGKQHTYQDRIEHDKIRDRYVSSQGIEVYRISWNEIKSENGSKIMKEKIDKFLKYIGI